jgi:alkanesulfonate monooxygenase SsuD/methylene tetrahydromethanopterin reductase-like flavin-dependent oxidoreductase (luciferase family)
VKIGIINAVRNHPSHPYPLEDVYADFISDAVLAEELGFDFAWYGEHHFTACQWTPSPMLVMSAVAAKTERIRIGVSVLCLPFHDPIRVAEDIAVLDIISRGRVDFGIGVGSQYEEYETFKVPVQERFGRTWEAIDLIQRCWNSTETFSFEGKYYTYPNVTFTTKPVQKPVPIWVGALGPKQAALTAKKGFHLLAGDASGNYDTALREAGRDAEDYFIAPMQQVAVAETQDQAWTAAAYGLHYFVNFYVLRKQLDGSVPPPTAEVTREMLRAGLNKPASGPGGVLVGTPAQAIEYIQTLQRGAIGRITHLPLGVRHAGMKTEDVHRTLRLLASEVLPVIRHSEASLVTA